MAPTRIALVPLVVHSADDRAYLRNGLRDMLLHRFAAVDEIQIVRIEDESLATSRLPEAIKLGRDRDADFVCFGSFTRFGSGASLDVQCASTRMDDDEPPLREIFVYSGNVGDVIPDLDELVGKITRFAIHDYETRLAARRVAAGLPPPPDPVQELRERMAVLEAEVAALRSQLRAEEAAERALAEGGEGAAAPPDGAGAPRTDAAVR